MTLRKYSAWLALCFGPLLLLQSALRHWGEDFSGWVLADAAAAILLMVAGVRVLKERRDGGRWLAGAWGFACATLWLSFFTLIPGFDAEVDPHEGQGGYLVMAGWLLITAVIGFVASLMPNQNARP